MHVVISIYAAFHFAIFLHVYSLSRSVHLTFFFSSFCHSVYCHHRCCLCCASHFIIALYIVYGCWRRICMICAGKVHALTAPRTLPLLKMFVSSILFAVVFSSFVCCMRVHGCECVCVCVEDIGSIRTNALFWVRDRVAILSHKALEFNHSAKLRRHNK